LPIRQTAKVQRGYKQTKSRQRNVGPKRKKKKTLAGKNKALIIIKNKTDNNGIAKITENLQFNEIYTHRDQRADNEFLQQ